MRSKADMSIFAWELPTSVLAPHMLHPRPGDPHPSSLVTGVLAHSPADFINAGDITSVAGRPSQEFSTTNVGIKIHAPLYLDAHRTALLLPLNCTRDKSMNTLSIRLLHLGDQCYLRLDPFSLHPQNPDTIPADLSTNRYLLPDHNTVSHSNKRWKLLGRIKSLTWAAFLQVLPSVQDSYTHSPWPLDYYDCVEESFFVGSKQLQDICCIKLGIRLPRQTWPIILLAAGWSDVLGSLQFGILPAQDYGESIKRVQDEAGRFHYDRSTFLRKLKYNNIPRKTSLYYTLPTTKDIVVVRANPKKHLSKKREFKIRGWSIVFSVETYSQGAAPAIERLEWVVM